MTKLSPDQQKVLDAFEPKNEDIDIITLYTRIYGDPGLLTARQAQQKLAPMFKRINEKLPKGRIEPGETKRTYIYRTNSKKG